MNWIKFIQNNIPQLRSALERGLVYADALSFCGMRARNPVFVTRSCRRSVVCVGVGGGVCARLGFPFSAVTNARGCLVCRDVVDL